MSGAVTAAVVSGALAAGTAAYSARQQRKEGQRARDAAERAAAKSQTQGSDPVQLFRRRRRMAQGFDAAALAATPTLGGTGGAVGGSLLGG